MSANMSSATVIVRRAFVKLDPSIALQAVDSLDLRGGGRVSAVIGVPLRNLQQRRDVVNFAQFAPVAALRALLELIAMVPLEKVIEALGEWSENPTFDQLSAAVDQVLAAGASNDEAVAVLAFAIVEGFPAAGHCRRLLAEREQFELPDLPEATVASSLLSPKQTDPRIREQRRVRREEEKQRKKGPSSARPPRPGKTKGTEEAPRISARADAAQSNVKNTPVQRRRTMVFTPVELERFDPAHALVGTIVLVEVPFDAVDPDLPEVQSKERPALIVAASPDAILIRAIYSNPSPTRSTFQSWRRHGFDHPSYIDDVRIALLGVPVESLKRLGRLSDQEWNAQF